MLEPQVDQSQNLLPLREKILEIFKTNKYLVVDFTKIDGDHRLMTCTIHPEVLPPYIFESISGKRKEHIGTISVWDLNKKDWRSFKIDRVNMITSQNTETGEESVLYIKDLT
jgi:hypothetical protein